MWNFLSLRPNGLNARKESSVKLRVVISQCGPSYLVWSLHKQFTSPASSTVHVPRLLQIASGQVPAGNGGWQVPLPTGNSSEEYLVWLSWDGGFGFLIKYSPRIRSKLFYYKNDCPSFVSWHNGLFKLNQTIHENGQNLGLVPWHFRGYYKRG